MDIKLRKESLDQRVEKVAKRAKRSPSDINILAVSKKQSTKAIRALYLLGQHSFGENYLQEALVKIERLKDLKLEWHYIGQIQRNKTTAIANNFSWVHGVDRLIIAERLSNQRSSSPHKLNICIQVSLSAETSKGGVTVAELPELANKISILPGLILRGLMIIPEKTGDPVKQRHFFHQMHELFSLLAMRHQTVDTLSMGMSADLELAIEEGSTMIRVGTALFGPRN